MKFVVLLTDQTMKRFQNSDAFARASRRFTSAGIRHFLNFSLIFTLLLTLGVGQMWAWYLPANIHYAAWNNGDNQMGGDNKIVFHAVPAGTYYFRLSNGTNQSGSCINTAVDTYISAAGWNGESNYITTTEPRDIWFYVVDEGNWKVNVWTEAPSYMIKYPWNGGSWNWSTPMSSNGDGTYSCVGQYGGTSYNKIKKTQNHTTGDAGTATIVGTTPSTGNMCVFTYTASTGALSIRKCNNITPTNYIFFDNSNNSLTQTRKYFVIGRPVNSGSATSKTYEMSEVENTKLWLHTSTTDTWTDANYFAVLGSSGAFDNGNWYFDNIRNASEYSAPHLTHYNMESGHNYIVSKADATNGTPISINEKGTTASSLNSSQTIKYAVSRNNGAYAELTSGVTPAQISISAYKFNNGTYNAVSNTSNSQTISANQSTTYSKSVSAAYTGETTLSYTSLQTGYSFIGWYDAVTGGNEISSTYYPTGTKVIYARFRENTYSVSFTNDGHGTVTLPTSTPQTVGQLTGIAINAENSTGYHFNNWTSTSGGSFTSATTASTNFYPTAATTVTANFAPNPYTITLNNQGATTAGSASIAVTFDATTNLTGTPAITVPEKTGYTFGGYYTGTSGSGVQIIEANGNVKASASGGGNTYTSSTKQWKYADNIELYAKWTANNYTITLNPNGGTGSTASVEIEYGQTPPNTDDLGNHYFSITNPTKPGYTFLGWYTAEDGVSKVIDENGCFLAPVADYTSTSPGNIWIHPDNATLYAHWQAVSTVPADPSMDDCQVTGLFGLANFSCQGLQGSCVGVTETIGSKNTRRISEQAGGNFYTNDLRNAPTRDHVHFEVWAAKEFTFTAELVGYNADFVYSGTQNYTTQAGEWKVVDVPLSDFSNYTPCFASAFIGFRLSNLANNDIWFANVYLYSESSACAAEPASAPTAPSRGQCQVQSIFSDTYTSVGISNYYDWGGGGSTKADRTVGGTKMYKVTVKNNYVGGFAINGKIDASAYEYIHMDVWTPLASTFWFSPICFNFSGGGNETEQYKTISTSAATWTSIDIPVSYFTGLGLTMRGNYQLKFDQCSSTYFWITNIYYYNTSSCPSYTPVAGSKHFGTAQRQNVALYSDADMSSRHANTSKILAQRFDYYIVDCGEQMLAKAVTRGKFGTGSYDQMVLVWNDAKTSHAENKLSQHNAAATEAFQRIGDADQYRWNGHTNTAPMNFYVNSQEQTTGLGFSEFFDYKRGYINNPTADATVPTLTSVTKTEETNWFTLTFNGGSDNSGQWFYYIEDTEFDIYKVSLEDTIRIPKKTDGQVLHFNCYAVDFNGNLSDAKTVTIAMPLDPDTNLALNKPIVAGAGTNIANINDGNLGSRNEGADTGEDYTNQWVYIDLEGYYTLSSIKIWFDNACPSNYVLQACETLPTPVNDDTRWRTIATRTTAPSTEDANVYDVSGSVARYVRIKSYHNYNNNAYGFSIWEFKVYGSAVVPKDVTAPTVTTAEATAIVNNDQLQLHLQANDGSTFFRIKDNETDELFLLETDGSGHVVLDNKPYGYCTQYDFDIQAMDAAANLSAVTTITPTVAPPALYNLATGATATAGHVEEGNTTAHAVDGRANTRWSSNGGADNQHWITVDLKKKYAISTVKLSWETACPKNYYLKASADGTNFYPVGHYTTVPATSDNGSAYETYTIPSGVEARYLQMYSVENNTGYGTSIFEFEAYGACATNSTEPLMTFAELKDVLVSSTEAEAEIYVGAWDDATAFGSLRYNVVFTAGGEEPRNNLTATDGLLTLSALTVGTTYTVRIYAVDGNGNTSANYKELTFTPEVDLYYLTGDATGTTGVWENVLADETSASKRRFAATEHEGIYTFSIAVADNTQLYRLYFDEEGDRVYRSANWSTAGNQQINNHNGETITVYAKDKDHFVSNFDEVYVYGLAVGAATEGDAVRMTNEGSTFIWQGAVTSGEFRVIVKATQGATPAYTDHSRNRIMAAAETFTNSESLVYATLTFDAATWTFSFERLQNYVIYHHGQAPDGGVEAYAGGTIPQPIEYRRKFEKDTWYSIYFPFDVTAVQVIDDEDGLYYDLKPYYRSSDGVLHSRHYIIRKATPATNMDISKFESKIGESGWLDPEGVNKAAVDSWLPEKDTPYMIQFHNDYYTDKWIAFIGAAGSTFATDFELGDAPADSGFVNIYGNNTLHSTSLTTRTYMINYNEYEGSAWTRFNEGTTLYPFEVYLRAEAKTTEQHQVLGRRPKQEDTATAVDDIYTETSCLRVYTLTGQLLLTLYHITPDDAGRQLQQQLGQGIYILHSDHSSYKLIIGGH